MHVDPLDLTLRPKHGKHAGLKLFNESMSKRASVSNPLLSCPSPSTAPAAVYPPCRAHDLPHDLFPPSRDRCPAKLAKRASRLATPNSLSPLCVCPSLRVNPEPDCAFADTSRVPQFSRLLGEGLFVHGDVRPFESSSLCCPTAIPSAIM